MTAKNEAAFYGGLLAGHYPDSRVEYDAGALEAGVFPASLDTFFYAVHVQTDRQMCCATSSARVMAAREDGALRQREGLSLPADDMLRLLQTISMNAESDPEAEDLLLNIFVMAMSVSPPLMERSAAGQDFAGHWMLCAYTFADQTLHGSITQLQETRRALLNVDAITAWSRRVIASDLGDGPNQIRALGERHGGILVFEAVARRW